MLTSLLMMHNRHSPIHDGSSEGKLIRELEIKNHPKLGRIFVRIQGVETGA